MSAERRKIWATYCGLTCLGGSEQRECSCEGPDQCEKRGEFDFSEAREEAEARFFRPVIASVRMRRDRTEPL